MNVSVIDAYKPSFKSDKIKDTPKNTSKNPENNSGFLDKFETRVINSADLNDTVKVPRTIFKGYLAFMVGTALLTLAPIAKKNKHLKLANTLTITAAALTTYGTFSFARPYIIKGRGENKNQN